MKKAYTVEMFYQGRPIETFETNELRVNTEDSVTLIDRDNQKITELTVCGSFLAVSRQREDLPSVSAPGVGKNSFALGDAEPKYTITFWGGPEPVTFHTAVVIYLYRDGQILFQDTRFKRRVQMSRPFTIEQQGEDWIDSFWAVR